MKKGFIHRTLLIALLVAIIAIIRYSGITKAINLDTIKLHRDYLQYLVLNSYGIAVGLFIATYMAIVILSLPLSAMFTVVGGYLFGTASTVLFTNIAGTIGALLSFLMFRYLFGQRIQERFQQRLLTFNQAMEENGSYYLLFVHFIAVVPFFLINILAAFTNVSLWTFIWTTSIGILPGSIIYAFAGQQLTTIASVRDVFSTNVLCALGLLAMLALAPVAIKKISQKKTGS